MVTSGAYAFNAAHCAAYGLISYYTAFLKVYEPDVFYAAALASRSRTRTGRASCSATPPSRSTGTSRRALRSGSPTSRSPRGQLERRPPRATPDDPGWVPVHRGIGEKAAPMVAKWRDERQPRGWGELQELKGFGPKTVIKITDWIKAPTTRSARSSSTGHR
jgi:hypothetical protein